MLELKSCNDCRHMSYEYRVCMHKLSVPELLLVYTECDDMRGNPDLCGIDAKLFEEKDRD